MLLAESRAEVHLLGTIWRSENKVCDMEQHAVLVCIGRMVMARNENSLASSVLPICATAARASSLIVGFGGVAATASELPSIAKPMAMATYRPVGRVAIMRFMVPLRRSPLWSSVLIPWRRLALTHLDHDRFAFRCMVTPDARMQRSPALLSPRN